MFGLSVEELICKSPRGMVPRQIAMYLAKQLTDSSLAEVGSFFGDMHHTTVMHATAKIDRQRRSDAATDGAITRLLKTLRTE